MGISLAAALLVTLLSLYWQSPRSRVRASLEPYRLSGRVRSLTMLALALLLLAVGFFVAGVPLDGSGTGAALSGGGDSAESAALADAPNQTAGATPTPRLTPVTGAFGGPPAATAVPSADEAEAEGVGGEDSAETVPALTATPGTTPDATATATPSPAPSATATPTSLPPTATPTTTPTPSPTITPTPTVTPTPISGPTAVINTQGSTLWVRLTPGGRNIALIRDRDVVLLGTARASQAGIIWQEITTVNGILGWVQLEYLEIENP